MTLSDAMLLGDLLKIGSNAVVLSGPVPWFNGLRCGDAVGGVIVTLGLERLWDFSEGEVWYLLQQDYPWIRNWHLKELTRMYGEVLEGHMTILQLVSVVRGWEDIAEFGKEAA